MKLSLSCEIEKPEELEMDSVEAEKTLLASNESLRSAFMKELPLTKVFSKNYFRLNTCNNSLIKYL